MTKARGFLFFLPAYLLFIIIAFLVNYHCFIDHFVEKSVRSILLFSVSQTTLTHFSFQFAEISSPWFHLFSIFLTQIAGLTFYTILLWLFHQLFIENKEVPYSLKKAFNTTLLVSAICEIAFFTFFFYGIPSELTGGGILQKLLAALTLAVNTFNNAGFSLSPLFFDDGIVANNFMIQTGIIGGGLLGGLGIFVVTELFSPAVLRKRLHDPSIDWSFMTKLSLFGAVSFLVGFLIVFLHIYFPAPDGKNILESIAIGLTEATAARGFGMHISAATETGISSIAYYFLAFTGSGPFTTGGGASLLGLLFIYGIFKKKSSLSGNVHTGYLIARKWMIISLGILPINWLLNYTFNTAIHFNEFFDIYLTNNMTGGSTENFSSLAIKAWTNIAGRLSFMLACFMVLIKKG